MTRADLNIWGGRTFDDTTLATPGPETRKLDAYLRAGLRRVTPGELLAAGLKKHVPGLVE